jgi:hypothetical protein
LSVLCVKALAQLHTTFNNIELYLSSPS